MSWLLSPVGSISSIDNISDVTITAVAAGEVLQWNGSAWINRTKAEAGLLANVVEDVTPVLGGNLVATGFDVRWGSTRLLGHQELNLADDATGTVTVGTYGFIVVVSTFNNTAHAIAFFTGTQAPSDIGSGSAVSLGTGANPDVDGNLNIWKSNGTTLSIKNRLGSTRTFGVFAFTPTAG